MIEYKWVYKTGSEITNRFWRDKKYIVWISLKMDELDGINENYMLDESDPNPKNDSELVE